MGEYQQSPCMQMGHPYAQVMLNPQMHGGEVRLRNVAGPALRVHALGYDQTMVRRSWDVGALLPGEELSLPWRDGIAGVALVDEEVDCAVEGNIKMPNFTTEIAWRP